MIHKEYICEILGRFEGKAISRGYVPCVGGNYTGNGNWEDQEVFGASGVTIGTGIDLGQQTEAGLRMMGINPFLLEKLSPYIGLKKEAALKKLSEAPLVLTAEETSALDTAVKTKYITEAARLLGRNVFERMPMQAQAVATSLHYQFGTPSRAASSSLALAWKALQEEDYTAAAGFLRNESGWSLSHRQYMNRRKQEAALLKELI